MWRMNAFLNTLRSLFWSHRERAYLELMRVCMVEQNHECILCPFYLRRNPFRYKAARSDEMFESCPIQDFQLVCAGHSNAFDFRTRPMPTSKGVTE